MAEGLSGGVHFRDRRRPHLSGASNSKLVLFAMRVEPVERVDSLCELMAGAAGEAVGLAGEADKCAFDFEKFERGVVLFGFRDGRAEVFFPGHD